MDHAYKLVPWTHSVDGYLRSGDSLMLKNKAVGGHLVADVGVRQTNIDESYRINTSKIQGRPITRNIFVLSKVEKQDIFGSDDLIRFG